MKESLMQESEQNIAAEKRVISRILAGGKEDYQLLVLAYQERIFAVINRTLPDEGKAKELTQETFIKAYLSLSQFRFESSFSTWLTRIALNLLSSYFSSREYKEKRRTFSLEEKACPSLPLSANAFDEGAVRKLQDLIGRLSPKLRGVFIICAIEQRSYEEAAAMLSIPVGTVRSRLNKARLILRQWYFEA